MKVIIAGSRNITNKKKVFEIINEYHTKNKITKVISGGARGVDSLGEEWAMINKIPVKRFIPAWDIHGKSAGYKRNMEMGDEADALLAIWNGISRGTKHMIYYMQRLAKPNEVVLTIGELPQRRFINTGVKNDIQTSN